MDSKTKKLDDKVAALIKTVGEHGHVRTLEIDWEKEIVKVEISLADWFDHISDFTHGQQ